MVILDNYLWFTFTPSEFYATKNCQLFFISFSIIIFTNQFIDFLLSVERRVPVCVCVGDSTNLYLIQPI